ncbi:MAG: heavy metal-binding domain-containing protein [Cyanobacteria bacterium J06623_1]
MIYLRLFARLLIPENVKDYPLSRLFKQLFLPVYLSFNPVEQLPELLQESRQEAVNRMLQQAEQLGANAVINVRFATSSVAPGAAELFAYGTAVKVQ